MKYLLKDGRLGEVYKDITRVAEVAPISVVSLSFCIQISINFFAGWFYAVH